MKRSLKLQINELKNDKIDLKELLKDSQDYLIKSKEEGQAHLQAEEHRWNNRLDSAKNEIIQLEDGNVSGVGSEEFEHWYFQQQYHSVQL